MIYRPEIDGLRAVAVLAVIFFHAEFSFFKGGYVGVDVFFVISGYLITSIILNELNHESFSLRKFYLRRLRRIQPVLLFIMIIFIPFVWLWMFSDQFMNYFETMFYTCLLVSNHVFKNKIEYFASPLHENPLIHTWSLSIEEQFYLVYPAVLVLIYRLRQQNKLAMIFISFISLSFGYMLYLSYETNYGYDKLFFSTLPRVWELMIGSFAAVAITKKSTRSFEIFYSKQLLSLFGLLAIVCSIIMFDNRIPAPSFYMMLPVMGTFFIIMYAEPNTWVGRLLSLKLLVGIGLISFSAYLWHQPLLVFFRLRSIQPLEFFEIILIIIFTIFLSFITWFFIEKPFRDIRKVSDQKFLWILILFYLVVTIMFFTSKSNRGFPARISTNDFMFGEYGRFVQESFNSRLYDENQEFNSNIDIAIIGDSYSQDFLNVLLEREKYQKSVIKTLLIPNGCGIYFGTENTEALKESTDKRCRIDYNPKISKLVEKAKLVILAQRWQPWVADRINQTIDNFPTKSKIVIVGTKNFGNIRRNAYISRTNEELIRIKNKIPEEYININNTMKGILKEEIYVDYIDLICDGKSQSCPVFTPDAKLISYDGKHLTKEGVKFVSKKLFSHPLYKNLF